MTECFYQQIFLLHTFDEFTIKVQQQFIATLTLVVYTMALVTHEKNFELSPVKLYNMKILSREFLEWLTKVRITFVDH